MTIIRPCYITREKVKKSTDVKTTAYLDDLVDDSIQSASRDVERFCHRIFYPRYEKRYFPWPDRSLGTYYRLWLDENELISVTTLSSGGSDIPPSYYFLEPVNTGPPYDHVELNIGSNSSFAFSGSPTYQRNVFITGLWGYADDSSQAGSLSADVGINDTTLSISNASKIGVGDLIHIDDERILVTDKTNSDTGETLQIALTASVANNLVSVLDASKFSKGEIITLDSERMLIVDITGNFFSVVRAYDGSVLAAHTGSTIYAYRSLEVTRAVSGTLITTHVNTAAITRYEPPAPIQELAAAYAVKTLLDKQSGYVSSTPRSSKATGTSSKGSSPTGSGTSGGGVGDIEARVKRNYVRKGRVFVV